MSDNASERDEIVVSSLYGGMTSEPYVQIVWGNQVAQFTVPEARAFGLRVLAAAEAAVTDAFLIEFLQEKVSLSRENAARVMVDYREWRAQRALDA